MKDKFIEVKDARILITNARKFKTLSLKYCFN